jgi:hypothetical protein
MLSIKLSVPVRWHAWCGERITADSTTLRIAVVSDRYWFETAKKEEFLNEEYVKELQQDGRLYDLPSNWGDIISMENLPYCETVFIEMLPDEHPWKVDKNHVRRASRSRELYQLNPDQYGVFPVRMEG